MSNDRTFIDHVFPEDFQTERQKRIWRRRVRQMKKQGYAPPGLHITTPPQPIGAKFLEEPTISSAFLNYGRATEGEKEDGRRTDEWSDS